MARGMMRRRRDVVAPRSRRSAPSRFPGKATQLVPDAHMNVATRVRSQANAALINARCSAADRLVRVIVGFVGHVVIESGQGREGAAGEVGRLPTGVKLGGTAGVVQTPVGSVGRLGTDRRFQFLNGVRVHGQPYLLGRRDQRLQARQILAHEVEHAQLLREQTGSGAGVVPGGSAPPNSRLKTASGCISG